MYIVLRRELNDEIVKVSSTDETLIDKQKFTKKIILTESVQRNGV